MRLQLVALLALALAGTARADPGRASASVAVYADDDDMLVVSPAAGVQAQAGAHATIDAAIAADTVTGASVDVVTSASPAPVREQREEGALGVTLALPRDTTVTARAIGSHEHDDDVVWGWALASRELADRNTTIELGWGHGESWITNAIDASFRARRTDDRATARVTQVIDARTYVDLLVDLSRTSGYQASPYRAIAIAEPAMPAVVFEDEATPRLRHTGAIAIRVRRAIGDRWFAHAGYRAVADDWGVASHTADARAIVETDDATWRFGASLRAYTQTAADFWRARYTIEDALRTRDRTLARMRSLGAALTIDRLIDDDRAARVQLQVGATSYTWPDDPLERARIALVTMIAITSDY